MKRAAEKTTTLFFLALPVAYVVTALGYAPGARTIPIVVAFTTFLVALVQLAGPRVSFLRVLVQEAVLPADDQIDLSGPYLKRVTVIVAWTTVLFVLICLLGFVFAVPIFMLSFLALVDRRSWLLTVLLTATMGLLTWSLIVVLLGLSPAEGLVWSLW